MENRKKQKRIKGLLLVILLVSLSAAGCRRQTEETGVQEPAEEWTQDEADGKTEEEQGEEATQEEDGSTEETADPAEEADDWLTIERAGEEYTYDAEDGTNLLSSHLYYPVIGMPENPEAAEKINAVFEERKAGDAETLAEYQEWAETEHQDRLDQGEAEFWGFALDRDYMVTFSGMKLLSVKEVEYSYAGGAHPSSFVITWNFDLETGEQVSLDQMTDDPEGLRGFLQEQIQNYLERQQLEDGTMLTDGLYPDYQDTIPELLKTPMWYVEENSLKIVFNEYEIAPYAAGIIEVEIPLADCQEYWNDYGRNLQLAAETSTEK